MKTREEISDGLKKAIREMEVRNIGLTQPSWEAIILAAAYLEGKYHWIPVEEELPNENGKTGQSISVWATNGLMSCEMRYNFDTKKWTDMWGDPFDVTHWMPMPQPPRKEER